MSHLLIELGEILTSLPPEKCYLFNNKLYVTLLEGNHNYYWDMEDQTGSIAIVDLINFTISNTHQILIDPYDIVIDKDGFVYIPSGSGQWINFNSYDYEMLSTVDVGFIRHRCPIEYNPVLNKIYTITTDLSPRDITVFSVDNGIFNIKYDSPYHGDYSMSRLIRISPDGNYIFNGSGNIFSCSAQQESDMIFYKTIDKSFTDVCFDIGNNKFYISGTDNFIHAFAYDTMTLLSSYNTGFSIKFIFLQNGKIIYIFQDEDEDWYISSLDVF